jgi:hypothetical protein
VGAPAHAGSGDEIVVNAATYPTLDGHRIHGTPVVPVVMVIEWFARAAKHAHPELALTAIRDVEVLRGIRVRDFEGAGERLRVACKDEPASGAPWSLAHVYESLLFHGAQFRAIRELHGVGEDHGYAYLVGVRELGWNGAWTTDPALLDGGLQLARLWGVHVLGETTLPTRIGAFVRHDDGRATPSALRCVLTPRAKNEYRTVTDLAFVDERGRAVFELRGVEMHVVPRESSRRAPSPEPSAE